MIVRFVYLNGNVSTVEERFLEFVNCSKKTGKDLAELYLSRLKEHNLPVEDLRGQGYDNASNMSGIHKGVQSEILRHNQFAIYCPCASHSLNLCGVHAVKCTKQTETFFKNIQRLYVLFSCSPSRWDIVKQELRVTFKSQSETRWSERIDALKPVAQQLPGVIQCLDRLLQEHSSLMPDAKRSAKQLKSYFSSFVSVLHGTLWLKVMQSIQDVNLMLQQRGISLDRQVKLIEDLISNLGHLRNSWDALLNEAKVVAEALHIPIQLNHGGRPSRSSNDFQDQTESDEHTDDETEESLKRQVKAEENFKINCFYVVMDTIIAQLTTRFESSRKISNSLDFLWNFDMESEISPKKAANLIEMYPNDFTFSLVDEFRTLLNSKSLFIEAEASSYVPPLSLLNRLYSFNVHHLFPQLCVALRIFLCFPVTIAEGERTFSSLSMLKNSFRTSMSQERLNSLALIHIESDIAKMLNYDDIITSFANKAARKVLI